MPAWICARIFDMENAAATAATAAGRQHDLRFGKFLLIANAIVPGAILAWDAAHGRIGANGVNYALHTTGLLALIFLLLTLLVTPLRRLTGINTLIAYRRGLGLVGFGYACVHFLIFYGLDRALSLSSTVHEILTRRYLLIGTTGLLLMVPLAVTSTSGMQMRLGAKRWKRLHRLVYLVAIAGALHYYMLVKSDVRQPLAFAGVLTALLGFRVVRYWLDLRQKAASPKRPSAAAISGTAIAVKPRYWSGELRVAQVFDETADVRTFRLMREDGQPLPFEHKPGQYLNLALTIGGVRVNRSYTIASPPTRGHYCEVTVKRSPAGHGSAHLHDQIRVGSTLKVSAPAGRFVFTGAEAERVILIAGGVGITPLMSMIRDLTDRCWSGQIYLVFSSKTQGDRVFAEELAYLGRRFANLHVFHTLSREEGPQKGSDWRGERGPVTRELLARVVPDVARGPVYLCGPEGMMAAVRKVILEMGLPEEQLKTEAFVSLPAAAPVVETVSAILEEAAVPAALAPPEGSGTEAGHVRFKRSNQVVEEQSGRTILETAEDAGVTIPFECRSGICGQCKTKLLSGRVTMETEDALSATEKARGFILACQAHALGDVTVDA
jgi:ferredoxin-NADP reductase/DMSO/TMAO reductase YedYZ heme-binding membrane subunit